MTEEKKCPLYKKCGGCQLQNLSYAEQLKFKQRKVENCSENSPMSSR